MVFNWTHLFLTKIACSKQFCWYILPSLNWPNTITAKFQKNCWSRNHEISTSSQIQLSHSINIFLVVTLWQNKLQTLANCQSPEPLKSIWLCWKHYKMGENCQDITTYNGLWMCEMHANHLRFSLLFLNCIM